MDEEQLAVHDMKVLLEWALDKAGWRTDLHLTGTKEHNWWGARCEVLAGELREVTAYEKALASQGAKKP